MKSIRNVSLVNLLLLIEGLLEKWKNELGEIEDIEEALSILKVISIEYIQETLGCSKRTAYDYKYAIQELVKIIQDAVWTS